MERESSSGCEGNEEVSEARSGAGWGLKSGRAAPPSPALPSIGWRPRLGRYLNGRQRRSLGRYPVEGSSLL